MWRVQLLKLATEKVSEKRQGADCFCISNIYLTMGLWIHTSQVTKPRNLTELEITGDYTITIESPLSSLTESIVNHIFNREKQNSLLKIEGINL